MKTLLERVGLNVVMVLAAVNIWTGAPLAALWVGSRVATSATSVSMASLFAVVTVLFAGCLAMVLLLSWASAHYDELTGRPAQVKRHVPWLRSMRGERAAHRQERHEVTAMERVLVVSVVLAVLAFEAWFFVASPAPIAPGPSKD